MGHDANVLALSAVSTRADGAKHIIDSFLSQAFGEAPVERGERIPEWWTPELVKDLTAAVPEVGKLELVAIDEGVQEFLRMMDPNRVSDPASASAPLDSVSMSASLDSERSSTPGTPPVPPNGSVKAKKAYE